MRYVILIPIYNDRESLKILIENINSEIKYDVSSNVDLIKTTLQLLETWPIEYGTCFAGLTEQIIRNGLPEEPESLQPWNSDTPLPSREKWLTWRNSWWEHQHMATIFDDNERNAIPSRLRRWNLEQTPNRSIIEKLWEPIAENDNWEPFEAWLKTTRLSRKRS